MNPTIKANPRLGPSSQQRRLNERYKEELYQLLNRFFEKSAQQSQTVVKANYLIYRRAWIHTVKKVNSSGVPCLLFEDAFENLLDKVGRERFRPGKWREKEDILRIIDIVKPPSKLAKLGRRILNFFRAYFFVLKRKNDGD